jgi:hypothetical protein
MTIWIGNLIVPQGTEQLISFTPASFGQPCWMRITWSDGTTTKLTSTGGGSGVVWTFQTASDVPIGTAKVYGECESYGAANYPALWHRKTNGASDEFEVTA